MKKRLIENCVEAALEMIFPSNIYCISCGAMIDSTRPYSLCDKCVKKIHWITGRTCKKCGKALQDTYIGELCYDCLIYERHFVKGFSCMTYGLLEREIIMDYKYNGKGYIGRKLGDILYDRISCENIKPDVIIPVPLSYDRMRKRGYNQSALMAKRLSELWSVEYDEKVLVRARNTQLLRSLNPTERRLMLEDAFSISKSRREIIEGKQILIIDDIFTTGATVDASAKALVSGGAAEVFVLTLASGGNRKPSCIHDSCL